jgi:hypothetical protein
VALALELKLPSLVLHVPKGTKSVVVYIFSTTQRGAEEAAALRMHVVGDLAESSPEQHD